MWGIYLGFNLKKNLKKKKKNEMVDDDGDWNDGDDVADARIDDEGKRKTVKERQKKKKRERDRENEMFYWPMNE